MDKNIYIFTNRLEADEVLEKLKGEQIMNFMDKKLEDIVVTLPFADGTSMDCGVFSYFVINNKEYFALLH